MFPLDRPRTSLGASLALVVLAVCATTAAAQSERADSLDTAPIPQMEPVDSVAAAPVPETIRRAETDSLLVLIPLRSNGEIRRELEAANARRSEAETRTARARVLQARAQTELDANRAILDAIAAKLKTAKQEKDAARRSELEQQRKFAQLERNLLERRETLRQQEIDLASADRDLAEATAKARDAELALSLKRDQHAETASRPGSNTVDLQTLERELQALERRALGAQIDEATQRQSFGRREVDLAKARLSVFEAQFKVLESGAAGR